MGWGKNEKKISRLSFFTDRPNKGRQSGNKRTKARESSEAVDTGDESMAEAQPNDLPDTGDESMAEPQPSMTTTPQTAPPKVHVRDLVKDYVSDDDEVFDPSNDANYRTSENFTLFDPEKSEKEPTTTIKLGIGFWSDRLSRSELAKQGRKGLKIAVGRAASAYFAARNTIIDEYDFRFYDNCRRVG